MGINTRHLILPGGPNAPPPHVVFLLYLLNSSFLGAEIFRLFLKFYGEFLGIHFELVRFRPLPWVFLLFLLKKKILLLSSPQFGACKTKFMKLKCRSSDVYRSVLQIVS